MLCFFFSLSRSLPVRVHVCGRGQGYELTVEEAVRRNTTQGQGCQIETDFPAQSGTPSCGGLPDWAGKFGPIWHPCTWLTSVGSTRCERAVHLQAITLPQKKHIMIVVLCVLRDVVNQLALHCCSLE